MFKLTDLNGLVVIITGASSGIGRSTVEYLLNENVLILANARNQVKLNETFLNETSENLIRFVGDCSDPAVCLLMVESAIDKWGKLDVLIANAGSGFFGSILENSDDEIVNLVNNNILGPIFPIRAIVPYLKKSKNPDIVIVSSAAGYRGYANEAVYAATKHAQVGLAGSLERELTPVGIRVSLVNPAGVKTDFAIGKGREYENLEMSNYMDPSDVAYVITSILRMPRRVRTQNWNFWSMAQES